MERVVIPEYLDSLPPDHRAARQNRRHLRAFNTWFGTRSWFRRTLVPRLKSSDSVLEIGAGEGRLSQFLFVASMGDGIQPASWTALDSLPVFDFKGTGVKSVVADLLGYQEYSRTAVVFGNMILHQFSEDELKFLGNQWARQARLLAFQEPARKRLVYNVCRTVSLPMGKVTRHDAPVSIRGGFIGDELPASLGLDPQKWRWEARSTRRGAYRFLAERL